MEGVVERECSALGGLFQQIISDMKNGTPLWEDFIAKATKLHTCLRAAIQAIAAYLDAFQKIADAATNARGATKDIGTALTRICLRHKAVEARMKTFTSAIMDCLIVPLQEKLEDWKKIVINLDKDHAKEHKRARTELKKRSTDTLRLQKKARKGGKCNELQRRVECCLQDVTERRLYLEETEKRAVRAALIEERTRFCTFVGFFKPVVCEEVGMLSEMTHIQEVAEQLDKISADPHLLPPASEQVITDMKGVDAGGRGWALQTPPSSPSSLGSRKSSMCSISSLNSSSSGSSKSHHSPNHYWQRSISQNGPLAHSTLPRHSSLSSQDSGFRSQDTLFLRPHSGIDVTNMCEHSDNGGSGTPSTPSTPHAGPNALPAATATWPNLQETLQFERAATAIMNDRPHTISSVYERGGHSRPSLTVNTFHAPEGGASSPASPVTPASPASTTPHVSPKAIYARPPIPQRCSSLERPSVPAKTEPAKTVLSKVQARLSSDAYQPPMYVNMSELASLAASKAQEMSSHLPPPPPELTQPSSEVLDKPEVGEKDGSTSESSLESSSGYGSQTTFPVDDVHGEDGLPVDLVSFGDSPGKYSTLPARSVLPPDLPQRPPLLQRPVSLSGYPSGTLRNSLLRKGSAPGQKPPPPIRRTASISSTNRLALLGGSDTGGSLENLPPPPAFLLNSGSVESLPQSPVVKEPPPPRVAETVRTLTELKHTPASPVTARRATTGSATRSLSAERRESVGSGLIAALSAKLAPNLSPRHSRRHSEDRSPVGSRMLQRTVVSPGQNFLESLNAKLALQQQQVNQNQLNQVHNAARVRQLFASRTIPDPALCHDSLMDQIKRGTSLKKTRTVNDRSAPKIH